MREPVKQLLTQIAAKKGAVMTSACRPFSLIYFFAPISIFYIPHNYVIPQAMPHAIPQTHSPFYPHRYAANESILKWPRLHNRFRIFRKTRIVLHESVPRPHET